jgi:hypothetical protein
MMVVRLVLAFWSERFPDSLALAAAFSFLVSCLEVTWRSSTPPVLSVAASLDDSCQLLAFGLDRLEGCRAIRRRWWIGDVFWHARGIALRSRIVAVQHYGSQRLENWTKSLRSRRPIHLGDV